MKTLSAKDSWGNGDARSRVNHLASCALPFCSCHPPQHICQWEKKTHSDRKPHPNKLLHDTKDHFFKLKFICSRNRVRPSGRTCVTAETFIQVANGGDCACKHTYMHKTHLVPVRPLDVFVWGQWFLQYAPPLDKCHCSARS